MLNPESRAAKTLLWIVGGVCLLTLATFVLASLVAAKPTPPDQPDGNVRAGLRLVADTSDTLELTPPLIRTLGVQTTQVETASSHRRLTLSGSLILDSNRMGRVHSRFAGEVVSIGVAQPGGTSSGETRPLRLGDHVSKGQLLAVIWSKDVGEKKSDLVNALSKLILDEAQLKSLRVLGKEVVAGRQLREAERERESDIIEVDRVERTLRSWRLTEEEINVVRAEAEKIHRGDVLSDMDVDKSWAEVEVRSPLDGIVLEKNIVAGDIVDTSLDLFKIADLSTLGVMAHVYEEDMPELDALRPDQRRWTIYLQSQIGSRGIPATFELVGNIVDPNQHTAAVMGWIDNKDGRMRDGQFITAVVDLPATEDEVVVPESAVIDDGGRCAVFVAADREGREVRRRNVSIVSRGQDKVYIRAEPTPPESSRGCQRLTAGEWVVISGCIELDSALDSELAARSASAGEGH